MWGRTRRSYEDCYNLECRQLKANKRLEVVWENFEVQRIESKNTHIVLVQSFHQMLAFNIGRILRNDRGHRD